MSAKVLNEKDAVTLASHFGRGVQEFAGTVGLTPEQAASQLALDPAALTAALGGVTPKVEKRATAKRAKATDD